MVLFMVKSDWEDGDPVEVVMDVVQEELGTVPSPAVPVDQREQRVHRGPPPLFLRVLRAILRPTYASRAGTRKPGGGR